MFGYIFVAAISAATGWWASRKLQTKTKRAVATRKEHEETNRFSAFKKAVKKPLASLKIIQKDEEEEE